MAFLIRRSLARMTLSQGGLVVMQFGASLVLARLLTALVSVRIVAMSLLGGHLLGEPGVRDVLMLLAVIPLLACLELLPAACIERDGNFRPIAMINLGWHLVATIVMLGFVIAGQSYMSLAYGQVAGAVVAVVAINLAGHQCSA